MTQRFLDDGRVERVTVLEAGPCPVTAIRTVERDGYEAVQLAFGACKEKSLTRAELGHLKKADASAHRHLVEFRDEAGELLVGETVTVEAFEVGDKVKVSGQVQGQGLPGHDQAPQLRQRAQVPRLAQRPRAGLDRRLGHALARVQGHPRPRPDGRRPDHPARSDRRRDHARRRICCSCAAPCPARRARPWRCGPMARTAPKLGGGTPRSTPTPSRPASTCRSCTRPCAPSSTPAARAPRSTKTRGEVSRRRRQAVAPEGHRPRPRRVLALARLDRRRHRVRPHAARTTPSRSTARRAAPRCAARCRCTPSASRWPCSTPACSPRPSTKQAVGLLADWGVDRHGRSCCCTEAEAARRQVVSQPRPRRRDAGRPMPAWPTSSAPRRCSSPRRRCRSWSDRADGDRRRGGAA